MKKLFTNWDYKKHAKIITGIYIGMYVIDMTLGYIVLKKCIDKLDDKNI